MTKSHRLGLGQRLLNIPFRWIGARGLGLVVHKRGAKLSTMTRGKCASLGIEPIEYGSTTELRRIVERWVAQGKPAEALSP